MELSEIAARPRNCITCKYGTIIAGSNEFRPCTSCYGYPNRDKWEPRTTHVQHLEAENARLRRELEASSDADLRRGIAEASRRLHLPVTRMMSRVIREEIHAARGRRLAGQPEPRHETPPSKALAREILAKG